MTAAKLKAKRARRPIYLVVRELMDPDTKERIGCLVPAHPVDRRLMRERKLVRGLEIRAELKQSRNPQFNRLVHAVGHLLVDNVDGFESLTSHDAIKRIQREAGVMCEEVEMNASPVVTAILSACDAVLGAGAAKVLQAVLPEIKTITVKQARSIAFDELDEAEFREFFEGIRKHVEARYIPALSEHARAEYWLMCDGGGQ